MATRKLGDRERGLKEAAERNFATGEWETKPRVSEEDTTSPTPNFTPPSYTLKRSDNVSAKSRKLKLDALRIKTGRRRVVECIVTACIDALERHDRANLFSPEQLLLLDRLYESAIALEDML